MMTMVVMIKELCCDVLTCAPIPILLLLLPDHRGEHQDVRDEALFILLNNIFLLAFVVYIYIAYMHIYQRF